MTKISEGAAANPFEGLKNFSVVQKRLLTAGEAAAYLGIAEGTIRNAVAPKSRKPIPGLRAKRIRGAVRFDLEDLKKFVDSL